MARVVAMVVAQNPVLSNDLGGQMSSNTPRSEIPVGVEIREHRQGPCASTFLQTDASILQTKKPRLCLENRCASTLSSAAAILVRSVLDVASYAQQTTKGGQVGRRGQSGGYVRSPGFRFRPRTESFFPSIPPSRRSRENSQFSYPKRIRSRSPPRPR